MNALPAHHLPEPPAGSASSAGRVSLRKTQEITWAEIATRAPQMALTMNRFLDQLAVSARPNTVDAYSLMLRLFAGRVTEADPTCVRVASIGRTQLEDYKRWLAQRPGKHGRTLSTTTIRHNLSLLRAFFERIIDWDYDDAPRKVPVFPGDFPQADEALPKSSTTQPPRSSWPHSRTTPTDAADSWSRSSPGPACAPVNSARSATTQ